MMFHFYCIRFVERNIYSKMFITKMLFIYIENTFLYIIEKDLYADVLVDKLKNVTVCLTSNVSTTFRMYHKRL